MNPGINEGASKKKGEPGDPPASPYGPQPHGADEAAGGADSSPYDNEPTGEERQRRAEDDRRNNRNAGSDDTNQSA